MSAPAMPHDAMHDGTPAPTPSAQILAMLGPAATETSSENTATVEAPELVSAIRGKLMQLDKALNTQRDRDLAAFQARLANVLRDAPTPDMRRALIDAVSKHAQALAGHGDALVAYLQARAVPAPTDLNVPRLHQAAVVELLQEMHRIGADAGAVLAALTASIGNDNRTPAPSTTTTTRN
ncbi:hypothetical protein AMAG_10014 [Allomyces macrogynus ATCC 38327]|uniref:Uncharacterized protein n=1 Tax=Allomyces macrogynus (strain ATCC 38327) TaxID=578462 RepID=A0A0L0SQ28_ALLM3|nr:hypothetical protein AMAG_10014 [Allomyces macrogynus ATCC 38327]|eukprot:KNE64658.1 hypothetical protein AMAG_10014 [Allomyces macrogynus ATCC 38327]